ncbi:PilT/PilU family type 4a pilus ATPase [candidate division WWE3 bacterium]|nr:PilT/PilU family type 4a pilus ATPase [candidate division WWE3 bacterium]
MKLNAAQLLEKVVQLKASDLHVNVGVSPIVRINTSLTTLTDVDQFTIEDVEYLISQLLNQLQKDILDVNKEIDLSVALSNKARFRVNVFYQRGYPALSLRLIPLKVPTIEDLNLPSIVASLCDLKQGLVLVTGPTGHGKSTTVASMIERINQTRAEHIVTIEDPIEYVFTNKKSLIAQREMHLDTHSWSVALKSVLRQDPNIVMVGEMRDFETVAAALSIAETGHLVFASLHTNSAAQTVDRIIDSFPEEQQQQVRVQFSQSLEAILSLRLIPSQSKGVIPAVEVLLASSAVRSLIREGKSHQIDNVISTSGNLGMVSLEKSIAQLVQSGDVELGVAVRYSSKTDELKRFLKGN